MKPARRRPGAKPKQTAPPAKAITGDDLEVRRRVRLQTVETARGGRTPLHVIDVIDVINVARNAAALADNALADAMRREPPAPPLACREGCAWCCYRRVGVGLPEVAAIAAYLQEHLTEAEMEQTRQRVSAALERRNALGPGSSAADRTPCPLLVDNRCQAYPVRPLTCRGFTSSDADACERWVTSTRSPSIPAHLPSQRLTTMALDGLRAGLVEAGLSGEHLDLIAALHVILSQPAAVQDWLKGQDPFRTAVLR
jgi:Fe-S-cluster containining protein